MRNYGMLMALLVLADFHKQFSSPDTSDVCQPAPRPKFFTVVGLTTHQMADAVGFVPSQVPLDAPARPAFDAFVARHNDAAQTGYCMEIEADKARAVSTMARAITASCHREAEPDRLATVLEWRNCAAGYR